MRAFVYILANTKLGVMYVGVTTHIARRIGEHRSGAVPGFASRHGAILLVYVETYDSILEARARERVLKRWRRDWKFDLIERENREWHDLSESSVRFVPASEEQLDPGSTHAPRGLTGPGGSG